MILAHIAGFPVEETLLGLAPAGIVGVGAALLRARERLASWRSRARRARR